jgi:hypothetical protein
VTFAGILCVFEIGAGRISRHGDRFMPVVHVSPYGDHTERSATACDLHRLDVASLELVPHPLPNTTLSRTARRDAGPMCRRCFYPCKCVNTRNRSRSSFAHVSRRVHHHRQHKSSDMSLARCLRDDDGHRDETRAPDDSRILLDEGACQQLTGQCDGFLASSARMCVCVCVCVCVHVCVHVCV